MSEKREKEIDATPYKEALLALERLPLKDRNLRAASIITSYVQKKHPRIKPIVVGGLSMEYYTDGGYSTQDIDFVATGHESMMSALEDLGFIREGRHAYHETIDVAVEIPDSYLAGDYKRLRIVRVNGKYDMYMISPEDIIADRMRAVVHWKEGYHTEWMAKILDRHKVDRDYIYSTVETKDEKEFLDAFFKEYDRSRK